MSSIKRHPTRRRFLQASSALPLLAAGGPASAALREEGRATILAAARTLEPLRALIVACGGAEMVAERLRGPDLDQPVNVKSVSKSVLSALVGIAIEQGVLEGVDQKVVPLLEGRVPVEADPRILDITIGHLLTMRAGLERTSGRNYGSWVNSADWVRDALVRPFVDEPGGRMLYSTGSYHLLSAALTAASGRSTLELARSWLGAPLGIEIRPWTRDPQGIYLGGNNMALSPRAMLRFGETYRQGGTYAGRKVLPPAWIERSWTLYTRSRFTGHGYGYGWFIARAGRHPVFYAWGYGGQMIYVVPDLALTVVMTSEHPSSRTSHSRQLHRLLADTIIPAAEG
ncbi:MAG TPA: serine hydrolase [Geminicoccaceae bacterium]